MKTVKAQKNWRKVFVKRIDRRIPMNVPVWVLVAIVMLAVVFVGVMINVGIQSERESAVRAYQEKQYIKESSVQMVRDDALKYTYHYAARFSPILIFILTFGVAFGLSNGVALVRVQR